MQLLDKQILMDQFYQDQLKTQQQDLALLDILELLLVVQRLVMD